MLAHLLVVLAIGVVVWGYQSIMKPRPRRICGSPNGRPVTSPRLRLRDGRFLAYKEIGVARARAKHKVIVAHGFNSSKDLYLPLSDEVLEELAVYMLTYDRAGYGESDPNPKRSPKSDAFDIQELADQLQLGPKFYVVGLSIGTYTTWGCLKYIPHRLAGAALVSPVINFWWPSLPSGLCSEAFNKKLLRDRWAFCIAHYAPMLFWVTQKLLPSSLFMSLKDFIQRCPHVYNQNDKQIFQKMSQVPNPNEHKVLQQGVHESLYRDILVFYGKWEFDPTDLKNPFSDHTDQGCNNDDDDDDNNNNNNNNNNNIHLWQGYEDGMAPFQLQRFISQKLPWLHYHEVPSGGHLIIHDSACCEAIMRALLHAN